MLEPQVVVNLSPKLGVRMDLMKHGYSPSKDSGMPREGSSNASAECSTKDGIAITRRQPGEHA